MNTPRRLFLQQSGLAITAGLGGLGGVAVLLPSCRRPPSRESVLSAIVLDIARADATEVATRSQALGAALVGLTTAPSLLSLQRARDEWRKALLAWKRAYCFRNGPIVDTNALLRVTFWPTRPRALETILRGDAPIDQELLDQQGADVMGLYALETLLFPASVDDDAVTASFGGDAGARMRSLVGALGRNVQRYANDVVRTFGDGAAFAERFGRGGQQSLTKLCGQMTSTVETIAANRLKLVLDLEVSHMLKPSEVEGAPSGSSHAIVLAQLEATERLYLNVEGRGITDLVRAAAPAIDDKLRTTFATAISVVRDIGGPLERVVKIHRSALKSAAAATKALELAMKVDLASALGVTLTFQGGDGD